MGRIAALALGASLLGAGALQAETAFDVVFRSGTLDGLPAGTELRYDGEGLVEAQSDEEWQEVVVDLGPGDEALVKRLLVKGEEPGRVLGSFDAGVGNPVAMLFLERTVNVISRETGGSPFYIRNRIRDTLGQPGVLEAVTVDWQGEAVPATKVVLVPFARDAHRADLGLYADLAIEVVVSEAVPGWYYSISAEAPATGTEAAYATSLSLAGVGP